MLVLDLLLYLSEYIRTNIRINTVVIIAIIFAQPALSANSYWAQANVANNIIAAILTSARYSYDSYYHTIFAKNIFLIWESIQKKIIVAALICIFATARYLQYYLSCDGKFAQSALSANRYCKHDIWRDILNLRRKGLTLKKTRS